MRRWTRAATVAVWLGLAGILAGCASDPFAEEYREGSEKGYIAGEFQYEVIPEAERTAPVDFEGVLDTGGTVTDEDYSGDVLVVNFWYAGCAPCRVEAPDLEAVHQEFAEQGVSFLGINTYDQAPTSLSFAEEFGITYPSALAAVDGAIKLAFLEKTPLQVTPTTLILDPEGKVAVRIIGRVPSESILRTLVRETLDEAS